MHVTGGRTCFCPSRLDGAALVFAERVGSVLVVVRVPFGVVAAVVALLFVVGERFGAAQYRRLRLLLVVVLIVSVGFAHEVFGAFVLVCAAILCHVVSANVSGWVGSG